MNTKYPRVTYDGRIYQLDQDAYISQGGTPTVTYYKAHGHDIETGEAVVVEWTNIYDGHHNGEDGECSYPGCDGRCEDESIACDWENPANVQKLAKK